MFFYQVAKALTDNATIIKAAFKLSMRLEEDEDIDNDERDDDDQEYEDILHKQSNMVRLQKKKKMSRRLKTYKNLYVQAIPRIWRAILF